MKVKAVFINKPGEVETLWVDYPHKKENEVLRQFNARLIAFPIIWC